MSNKSKKQTRVRPTQEHLAAIPSLEADDLWLVPKDLSHLSEYSLEILSSYEHRRGVSWEAHLYKGDRAILWVDNDGSGGCNSYHPVPGQSYESLSEWRQLLDLFVADATNAYGDGIEPHDRACSLLDAVANIYP